jgi:predicted AlkP superfamily pyrophosphatase or phosphodiesterase
MIADGAFSEEKVHWMQMGPGRKNVAWLDESWTRAAQFIFEKHHPNLLLYHILNTDAVHHTYGPGTMASYTALAYADRLVGDLLKTIADSGLKDRTTVAVTTDHGFKKVSKLVRPNLVLRNAGFLKVRGTGVGEWEAYVMTQGGMAFVYVRDAARRAGLLPRLRELFSACEGVERVLEGPEALAFGMPLPEENSGMGDLVLYAGNGYAFRQEFIGEDAVVPSVGYAGTHGYPSADPELDGICIFSGCGIRKGVELSRMANLDVAPTLARVLGLRFPKTDGRVLDEVLAPER